MQRTAAAVLTLALAVQASVAWGWGSTGHRLLAIAAVRALPPELPAFVRAPDAQAEIAEIAREPDRSKGAGEIHDKDRDPGHFVDLDDQGRVLGGPSINVLPPTRLEYQKALVAAGTDEGKAGYLTYALVDGWQQLTHDFAYWRVLIAAERLAQTPERRAWYAEDRRRREQLILRDLGVWAHYVGDASQPHHTSIHFNGWGPHANPEGFTQAKVHGPFEGAFTRASVTLPLIEAALPAPEPCAQPIEVCVVAYLKRTNAQVLPYYRLEKAGGFQPGDPRGRAFATERVSAGAAALRDLTVLAWAASARSKVGWPVVSVADVEAGRADPFDALYGTD